MLRILMLDDDRVVQALARALRKHGIALDFCFELGPFLLRVREGTHRILVLDELFPGQLGSQTCLRLREAGEERPIVLTSAAARRPDGVELVYLAEEHGANAFCAKELEPLAATILRLAADPGPPAKVLVRRLRFVHVFTDEPIAVEGPDLDRVVFEGSDALTPLQHRALSCLLRFAPREVTADVLVRVAWRCAVGPSAVWNGMRRLMKVRGDWVESTENGWRARVFCVHSSIHQAYATALVRRGAPAFRPGRTSVPRA